MPIEPHGPAFYLSHRLYGNSSRKDPCIWYKLCENEVPRINGFLSPYFSHPLTCMDRKKYDNGANDCPLDTHACTRTSGGRVVLTCAPTPAGQVGSASSVAKPDVFLVGLNLWGINLDHLRNATQTVPDKSCRGTCLDGRPWKVEDGDPCRRGGSILLILVNKRS